MVATTEVHSSPGVYITTTSTSVDPEAEFQPHDQMFIVGQSTRGSITAYTDLRSMGDVDSQLGERLAGSYVYDTLATYFAEGGVTARFARVAGPGAVAGTLTLKDQAVSPLDTLTLNATSVGAWSDNLDIVVAAGTRADTFRIKIYYKDELVQDENNITSPAAAVTRFANSPWVNAVDKESVTAAPDNNPAVLSSTPLDTGTDDAANIETADYVTALGLFTEELGSGIVVVPGIVDAIITEGLDAHCVATNRIALVSGEVDDDVSEVIARVSDSPSSYVGIACPWINIVDESQLARTIPPEGYIAACRTRACLEKGPWRMPAGDLAISDTITGLASSYTADEIDQLNESQVIVIKSIAGIARNYGWYSTSTDDQWTYLKDRDTINYIVNLIRQEMEKYVFEVIDSRGQLIAHITSDLNAICSGLADRDAFYRLKNAAGTAIDNGYLVNTGPTLNNQQTAAENTVKASVSVRISPAAQFIDISINKVGTTTSITAV